MWMRQKVSIVNVDVSLRWAQNDRRERTRSSTTRTKTFSISFENTSNKNGFRVKLTMNCVSKIIQITLSMVKLKWLLKLITLFSWMQSQKKVQINKKDMDIIFLQKDIINGEILSFRKYQNHINHISVLRANITDYLWQKQWWYHSFFTYINRSYKWIWVFKINQMFVVVRPKLS